MQNTLFGRSVLHKTLLAPHRLASTLREERAMMKSEVLDSLQQERVELVSLRDAILNELKIARTPEQYCKELMISGNAVNIIDCSVQQYRRLLFKRNMDYVDICVAIDRKDRQISSAICNIISNSAR